MTADLHEHAPPVTRARFWVFAGEVAAPAGGMHDFQGAYGLLADAMQAGVSCVRRAAVKGWVQIVDSETRQIIAGTKQQALGAPLLQLPWRYLFDA